MSDSAEVLLRERGLIITVYGRGTDVRSVLPRLSWF